MNLRSDENIKSYDLMLGAIRASLLGWGAGLERRVHGCRYYTGEGWVPKKMDVLVEAPDRLSLKHLRSTGLQPGACPEP